MTKNVLTLAAVAALITFIAPAGAHTGSDQGSFTTLKSAAIDSTGGVAIEIARGADDPAGNDRGGRGRGTDDPAGHASIKTFDPLHQIARGGRGKDDPIGHG